MMTMEQLRETLKKTPTSQPLMMLTDARYAVGFIDDGATEEDIRKFSSAIVAEVDQCGEPAGSDCRAAHPGHDGKPTKSYVVRPHRSRRRRTNPATHAR